MFEVNKRFPLNWIAKLLRAWFFLYITDVHGNLLKMNDTNYWNVGPIKFMGRRVSELRWSKWFGILFNKTRLGKKCKIFSKSIAVINFTTSLQFLNLIIHIYIYALFTYQSYQSFSPIWLNKKVISSLTPFWN